jgi:hypothetical protein
MAKSGGKAGGRIVKREPEVLHPIGYGPDGNFIAGVGRWAEKKFVDVMNQNWRNIREGNFDTGPSQIFEDFHKREQPSRRIKGPNVGLNLEFSFGGGRKDPPNNDNNTSKPDYKGGNSMGYPRKGNKGKGNGNGSGGGGNTGGTIYSSANSSSLGGPNNWPLDMSEGKGISDLNTGIRSGLTSLTQQPSIDQYFYTGCYLCSIDISVTGTDYTTSGGVAISNFRNFVLDLVYPIYVQYIQENLNYKEVLSIENFLNYFEAVSNALQLYYSIEPIINYSQNPESQNYSMNILRESIQASELERLYLLRERLEQMVFPPKMLAFIKWMYQLYSFNTIPGSPVIKFVFKNVFQPGNTQTTADPDSRLSPSLINYHINELLTLATNGTGAVMNQVFSQWKITQLPPSHPVATFDPQFTTLWANQGHVVHFNSTTYRLRAAANEMINMPFGSYVNVLDGLIPAVNTIYNEDNGTYGNGIMNVWDDFTNFSTEGLPMDIYMINDANTSDDDRTKFLTAQEWMNNAGCAQQALMGPGPNNSTLYEGHEYMYLPGMQAVNAFSIDMTRQPAIDLVRYIWHLTDFRK